MHPSPPRAGASGSVTESAAPAAYVHASDRRLQAKSAGASTAQRVRQVTAGAAAGMDHHGRSAVPCRSTVQWAHGACLNSPQWRIERSKSRPDSATRCRGLDAVRGAPLLPFSPLLLIAVTSQSISVRDHCPSRGPDTDPRKLSLRLGRGGRGKCGYSSTAPRPTPARLCCSTLRQKQQ